VTDTDWTKVKVERVQDEMRISGVAPIGQAFEIMRIYERQYEVCASMKVTSLDSGDFCCFEIVLCADEGLGEDETVERYLSFFCGCMAAKGWNWRQS
jgi:hypothetical protein